MRFNMPSKVELGEAFQTGITSNVGPLVTGFLERGIKAIVLRFLPEKTAPNPNLILGVEVCSVLVGSCVSVILYVAFPSSKIKSVYTVCKIALLSFGLDYTLNSLISRIPVVQQSVHRLFAPENSTDPYQVSLGLVQGAVSSYFRIKWDSRFSVITSLSGALIGQKKALFLLFVQTVGCGLVNKWGMPYLKELIKEIQKEMEASAAADSLFQERNARFLSILPIHQKIFQSFQWNLRHVYYEKQVLHAHLTHQLTHLKRITDPHLSHEHKKCFILPKEKIRLSRNRFMLKRNSSDSPPSSFLEQQKQALIRSGKKLERLIVREKMLLADYRQKLSLLREFVERETAPAVNSKALFFKGVYRKKSFSGHKIQRIDFSTGYLKRLQPSSKKKAELSSSSFRRIGGELFPVF